MVVERFSDIKIKISCIKIDYADMSNDKHQLNGCRQS